jgi:hypothetical protein
MNTEGMDFSKPIEEARFTPPPMDKRTPIQDEKPKEPFNPEMKNLGKKDTEMAAGHMAKLIIQGYEWMHDFANKGLQVPEKKLLKMQSEGEINLNAMIDYDYGKKIRAGEFFNEYNKQVSGVLKVSDEFKEEATPLLEKVLAKRGVGMTDEQMLMFVFAKDIAAKSLIFFQQKSQMNYMIQSIKAATTAQFVQAAPPPQPQQAQQAQQQDNQQPRATEPEENNFNNKPVVINGTDKRKAGRPRKDI